PALHRELLSFPTRRSSDLHKELLIRHYDISVVASEELIDLAVVPCGVGREFIGALTVTVGIGVGIINRGLVLRRDFLHVENSCQDRKSTRLNSSHASISYA